MQTDVSYKREKKVAVTFTANSCIICLLVYYDYFFCFILQSRTGNLSPWFCIFKQVTFFH